MKKSAAIIISVLFSGLALFAQVTTDDAGFRVPEDRIRTGNEGFASEEFRRGVQAYYRCAFNDAIVQFERALTYLPHDNLILEWLGKSYYKSGLEGSALSYWQTASDNGYGGLLLENKIEIIRERRVTGDSTDKTLRLSEAGAFPGDFNGNMIYSGPVSILANYDGTMWVAAYNSNELLLLNQNGVVIDRVTGPINGFDRPSDIIRLNDGNILLAEHAGDRLALLNSNARFIKYIGSKGRGLGQMVGPLYLAQDYLDRIYVTDYGNRRVDVFDNEGNALFSFGGKQGGFSGLRGPTGVAVQEESVFVADDQSGCIYEFDRAGNYIRELVEPGTFTKPEGIRFMNGSLVLCDANRLVSVDLGTGATFEYVRTGNAPSRVTVAEPDVNGNVVVTDFTANEIYVMSKVQELVGGFFVQIEQLDASKFPQVTVELRVENRHRQPVVGLQQENFFLTEKQQPVVNLKLLGAASNNTEADVTIIIDRSNKSLLYKTEIESSVKEIVASMNSQGVLRIVSAGAVPVTEYVGRPDLLGDFSIDGLKTPLTNTVAEDLAIRLAANDLVTASKKRSIVIINAGDKNDIFFRQYNLSELTAYMNNNSVGCSVVQMSQNALPEELSYIVDNTAGKEYYVYRPQGLSEVIKDIIETPQGIYQLSFTSSLQKNYGLSYLPLEAEVYLLNKSGRDETGYFAPLE
jgi:DNA-binding beta-propeller fold protein YncE